MKKTVSIVLLVAFLFNMGGYYLFFWGLRIKLNQELISRLDAEAYYADETLELKIPLTLPYPLQTSTYERTHGMFEHQGEFYKLVKQKLAHDTLYIICIKDKKEKQLAKAFKDFVGRSHHQPDSKNKQAANWLGKLLSDFESGGRVLIEHITGWVRTSVEVDFITTVSDPHEIIFSPPPESVG